MNGPLQLEPVPAVARLSPDQLAGAEAVWVWSPLREPRRLTPEELQKKDRPRFGTGRTILVRVPAARQMRGARPRLIAAPIEMWREVPEPMLPSWPLPKSGRLEIPADASRPWRLRVAGDVAGSFWTDLPAGAKGAVLAVVPASGAHSSLVEEGGQPAEESSVRILESGLGRLGGGKGATVAGRLLDAGGRPLAGASVRVEAWASAEAPISFIVQAETDLQGRFEATAVPPGKAALMAAKSGWATFRQMIEVPREGLDVGALSLSRGDSLAVRVVNDAGEPVAGAELRPDLGEPATTAPDGTALLTHLPEGTEIRIAAAARGHLRAVQTVQIPVPRPVELQLQRAFSVSGRFTGVDGNPLADSSVKMTWGRGFDTAALEPDGSFLLALRPAQDYTLAFTSPQSASLEVPVPEGAPGEERDLGELCAPASGEVVGRLIDGATGDPVPGARVWCPRPSAQGPLVAWMSRDVLEASSGPDGTFRLNGVPSGHVALRIESPGFAHVRRDVDVPGEDGADLGDIPLPRGMTLAVTTGPRGEGTVVFVDPGGLGLIFDHLMAPVVNGVARVGQVPPGNAKISVKRGPSILCEKLVQVPAEEQAVALPFPDFSVAGIIHDEEDRPVEGARVREVEGGTTILSAEDGSFRFEGLRAKTYFFSAAKDEAASEPLEVAVGEGQPKEPLVLVLRPEGRRPALEVSVADERGVPVAGAFVFIELPGQGMRVLTADSSGVAKLLLDPPYPETVRAAARIGMTWALGPWQPFDRARNGLALSPGPTGSLGLVAGESQGLLQISARGAGI